MGDRLTPVTKENIEALLKDLLDQGEYPEAVAKVLKRKRIKGHRRGSEDCPIAAYLRKKLALGRGGIVSVGATSIYVSTSKAIVTVIIPSVIAEFIHEFDNLLRYSELESIK